MKEIEEYLLDYIMRHTYSCPVKEEANINFEKECVGYREEGCRECILKHAHELN